MARPLAKKLSSTQDPKGLIGTWISAALGCGISFAIFYVFAFQGRNMFFAVIGVVVALFGVAMLFSAIRATLEYLKYGQVYLAIEGAPPAAGGVLSARLSLPPAAAAAGKVTVELVRVEVTLTRDNDGDASWDEHDAWTEQQVLPVRHEGASGHAALRMNIPGDQPHSDSRGVGPDVAGADPAIGHSFSRWELRVEADVPGIDLKRSFQLVVGPATGADAARAAALAADPAVAAELKRRMEARRAALWKLTKVSAFVAAAPLLAIFAVIGLAVGLAGCPLAPGSGQPPVCEFAGLNWGPLAAGAFRAFVIVPAGFAAALLLWMIGSIRIARKYQPGSSMGRAAAPAVFGLCVLVGFLHISGYLKPMEARLWQAWDRAAARINTVEGFDLQPEQPRHVSIAARGLSVEAHGNELRVRFEEIRLEKRFGKPPAEYTRIGIVVARSEDVPRGSFGYVWDDTVRGTLTSDTPVAIFKGRVFRHFGAQSRCAAGGCEIKLMVVVQAPGKPPQREDTQAARLEVRPAATSRP